MLTRIHIRNFAIIDELELEFVSGLSVITGETGAGKSIMIDALGLVLGGRADKSVIGSPERRCEISASVDLRKLPAAQALLREQALDDESEECVLRRSISADGRSRAFINSISVSLQTLKMLGDQLVEIHGQHAHQTLGSKAAQRLLLDQFAGHQALVEKLRASFEHYQQAAAAYTTFAEQSALKDSRLEFLEFQVRELETVAEIAGDADSLQVERDRLAHTERLQSATHDALAATYDNESANALSLVTRASERLADIADITPELDGARALLSEAEVSLTEAADAVRRYQSSVVADPGRRDEVENALAELKSIARKHRIEIAEIAATLERLTAEKQSLADADSNLAQLGEQRDEARALCLENAKMLSRSRKKAAAKFSSSVTKAMQQLGMQGGQFEITVSSDSEQLGVNGVDRIEFLVSANPGSKPQSLAKVASGGELSRISLSIQVIAANLTDTPCLIFDEVDSGVGGAIAEIVGKRLRELGESRQVLCVTHLPQVASQGHQQFRVSKISDDKTTRTRMVALSEKQRVEEIARMLGGINITEKSRAHAREMLTFGKARESA